MFNRSFIRFLSALTILCLITFSIGYASYKHDPFAAYREFIKKPVLVKPKQLVHFAAEEQLIRDKLKLNLSVKERSILSGLYWVIGLMDDDKNFKAIFADFLLLIDSLTNSRGRVHQQEVAVAISKTSFLRAQNQLSEMFNTEEESGWRFLGLFPILTKYPKLQESYFEFYKKQWPDFSSKEALDPKEFAEAIKDSSYQELFDALVITSFPHYYRLKSQDLPVLVPQDKFPEYLKEFAKLNYQEYSIEDANFRALGYLATHLPLVLTNYCEYPLTAGAMPKTEAYIKSSFEKARQAGDFDLYAEYILGLKMYGAKAPEVKSLEKFIYDLQRSDGSWGRKVDFTTSSYTAIHPSGAALMSLNCGS